MKRQAWRVLAALALLLPACNALTERRLRGVWETEATPKRRLELLADGRYTRRLSGKTLGFLSEMLGPETGRWRVEDGALVLFVQQEGRERAEKLSIEELGDRNVLLAGEHWIRLDVQPSAEAQPSVDTPASPR
ncbi:MAG: hypothetical protein AB7O37_12190 [Vicinamibacteria bacterium]